MCMGKSKMCVGHLVAGALVVVGALNWGLVGLFSFNLVNAILGGAPVIERLVYVLVGLAALFMLAMCHCKKCGMGGGSCCKKDGEVAATGDSCCGGEKKM